MPEVVVLAGRDETTHELRAVEVTADGALLVDSDGGGGAGTVAIQEDDVAVADVDTINFEGGGGKVTDDGGGKVTVDIAGGGGEWTLDLIENPGSYPGTTGEISQATKNTFTATTFPVTGTPLNALDGNLGTSWDSDSGQNSGDYFAIDMQVAFTLGQLSIYSAHATNWYQQFQIEASDTGAWGGEEVVVESLLTGNQFWNHISISPAYTARYWRLKCTSTNIYWVQIDELEFEEAATLTVVGVPYGWSAVTRNNVGIELESQTQNTETYGPCVFDSVAGVAQIVMKDEGGAIIYENNSFSPSSLDLYLIHQA